MIISGLEHFKLINLGVKQAWLVYLHSIFSHNCLSKLHCPLMRISVGSTVSYLLSIWLMNSSADCLDDIRGRVLETTEHFTLLQSLPVVANNNRWIISTACSANWKLAAFETFFIEICSPRSFKFSNDYLARSSDSQLCLLLSPLRSRQTFFRTSPLLACRLELKTFLYLVLRLILWKDWILFSCRKINFDLCL